MGGGGQSLSKAYSWPVLKNNNEKHTTKFLPLILINFTIQIQMNCKSSTKIPLVRCWGFSLYCFFLSFVSLKTLTVDEKFFMLEGLHKKTLFGGLKIQAVFKGSIHDITDDTHLQVLNIPAISLLLSFFSYHVLHMLAVCFGSTPSF